MHDHGHEHSHALPGGMKSTLRWAVIATIVFVVVEFVGGWLGKSLALMSDAVHNLTDVPTLVISWVALRLAERPPTDEKTFGYHRAGILAAFSNAIVLVLVAAYIVYEAVLRLRMPEPVRESVMLWISMAGLVVNGGITLAFVKAKHDLNLRTILIHNLGDAISNVAIVAGALVIGWTGMQWVDPVLGLAIGALVVWSSVGVLKESAHILLEGMPRGMKLEEIAEAILRVEGVREVHDIHVWTLGTGLYAMSCHVKLPDMHMDESERVRDRIQEQLAERFRIDHSTIQMERAGLAGAGGFYMPEPVGKKEAG